MMSKQQKIVEHSTELDRPRVPKISERSRELAKNRTFADLHKPKTPTAPQDSEPQKISQSELNEFLKRNYHDAL